MSHVRDMKRLLKIMSIFLKENQRITRLNENSLALGKRIKSIMTVMLEGRSLEKWK